MLNCCFFCCADVFLRSSRTSPLKKAQLNLSATLFYHPSPIYFTTASTAAQSPRAMSASAIPGVPAGFVTVCSVA